MFEFETLVLLNRFRCAAQLAASVQIAEQQKDGAEDGCSRERPDEGALDRREGRDCRLEVRT